MRSVNRLLVMLTAGALMSTLPAGVASGAERANPESVTQLILLFFSDVSRVFAPRRVVAEDKDWKIVTDAEEQQEARKSQEERRREAYKRLEEQERAVRKAREEYRRETRNLLLDRPFPWSQPGDDARGREARRIQEERLRAAERRLQEQEREAQRAKEAYQLAARMAREERRREFERARLGG